MAAGHNPHQPCLPARSGGSPYREGELFVPDDDDLQDDELCRELDDEYGAMDLEY